MELQELQNIWVQYERDLAKNTQINKEILRNILLTKTEKKVNWLKIRSLINLIFPIPMFIFIVIPRLEFSLEIKFIVGIVVVVVFSIVSYAWAIKYYILVNKLDFYEPLTSVKKHLIEAEKYKFRITRFGLMLAPFMIIGIFLSVDFPIFSEKMILFYSLMLIVMILSAFIQKKHGVLANLKRIKRELEEIVKLEGEK